MDPAPVSQNTTSTFISKYKPYFIQDFCTDAKFKAVLQTLFDIDDLNMLIVGASSSGKTSILYAILREYYGLSKHQSFPENNLLFINSLKEQGINYYRNEMKTFCQSRCSIYGKKKMIIVDDIDTINEQCQQVFRNYIDKYKSNVHFISACSNIQKVIESIQSRIHILRIDPPSPPQIREVMQKIITDRGIAIDQDAQDYLLTFSNHSIRALVNHLEKIYILSDQMTKNTCTLEMCKQMCANISFQQFEEYLVHLKKGDVVSAIHILYHIHEYGYSVIDIFDYFYTFIKLTLLLTEHQKYQIIPCLCKYITIFHTVHEDCIELALFTNTIVSYVYEESTA